MDFAESTHIAFGVASKVLLLCFIIITRLYISFMLFSESFNKIFKNKNE